MTSTTSRIALVQPEDFSSAQADLAGDWRAYSFTQLMVKHLPLYRVFMPLGEKLMAGSELPPRVREILILRTLGLCGETYDTDHHKAIARGVGMSAAEIEAVRLGSEALALEDRVLVQAAEELIRARDLTDETYRKLAERYSEAQLIELVFLVGNFAMVSMVTRTFRIPSEHN